MADKVARSRVQPVPANPRGKVVRPTVRATPVGRATGQPAQAKKTNRSQIPAIRPNPQGTSSGRDWPFWPPAKSQSQHFKKNSPIPKVPRFEHTTALRHLFVPTGESQFGPRSSDTGDKTAQAAGESGLGYGVERISGLPASPAIGFSRTLRPSPQLSGKNLCYLDINRGGE